MERGDFLDLATTVVALILSGSMTVRREKKVLLHAGENSRCGINQESSFAQIIQDTKLLV